MKHLFALTLLVSHLFYAQMSEAVCSHIVRSEPLILYSREIPSGVEVVEEYRKNKKLYDKIASSLLEITQGEFDHFIQSGAGEYEVNKIIQRIKNFEADAAFFVGNGMRPYYELARAIIKKEGLGITVYHLPISRRIFEKPEHEQQLLAYLGRATKGLNSLVLIDSISVHSEKHSIEKIAEQMQKARTQNQEPEVEVSMIAIPESSFNYGAAKRISGYEHNLDYSISNIAYQFPRWYGEDNLQSNGKYSRFDQNGNPTTPWVDDNLPINQTLIEERMRYIKVYGELLSPHYP